MNTENKDEQKYRRLLPKPSNFRQTDEIKKYPDPKIKKSRQYDCLECGQKWNSYRRLKEHEEVHNCINICNFCNSMMKDEITVESHKQQNHQDGKYECQLCKVYFISKKKYYKHIQTVHKMNNYFICTLCLNPKQSIFSNKNEILDHFEIVHSQQVDDELHMNEEFLDEFLLNHDTGEFSESWADLDLDDVLRISPNNSKNITYKCPNCLEEFTTQKQLLIHLGHIHDLNVLICNKCESVFNRRNDLADHKMMHRFSSLIDLQCKICDKEFKTSSGLNYHIKTHTGLKPHKCPYCQKQFQANANFKKHLRIIHSYVKLHTCNQCDKQFSTLDHLKKHVLSFHQNERQHLCNVCGKRFFQLCHLKQHMINKHKNSITQNLL